MKLAFRVYLVSFHRGSSTLYLNKSKFGSFFYKHFTFVCLGRYEVDRIMEILPDVSDVEDQIHRGVRDEKGNAGNRKNSFEYNTINVCGEMETEKFI